MSVKKIVLLVISLAIIFIAVFIGQWYYKVFKLPMVKINKKYEIVYIPTHSNYHDVVAILFQQHLLDDTILFNQFAALKKYPDKIKPGRYKIQNGLSANALINKLRSGSQFPVKLIFNNIRFLPKLAGIVASKLELDSTRLMNLLLDPIFLERYNLEPRTAISLFLPNTYEFYWNTNAFEFIDRMKKEHDKFWNAERTKKALEMGLTPLKVNILASIIQEETNKKDEMSRMAGVLINRLNRGMKLQADPTARFAHGDFSINRVLKSYTSIESPYNTYWVTGLPPGPIAMSEPSTIDAVLNYEKHNYLFYCAKADGSGYHVFARTNSEHIRNAKAYRRSTYSR